MAEILTQACSATPQEISTARSTTVELPLRAACSKLLLTELKPCYTASPAEPMARIPFRQWCATVPAIYTAQLRKEARPTPVWYSKWIRAAPKPYCTTSLEEPTA